jgi:hypothetical protein
MKTFTPDMPTGNNREDCEIRSPGSQRTNDDASETILFEESVTLLGDESCIQDDSAQAKGSKVEFVANLVLSLDMSHDAQGPHESDTVHSRMLLGDENKNDQDETFFHMEDRKFEANPNKNSLPRESSPPGHLRNQKVVAGPNEMTYCSKYEKNVQKAICEFNLKYPGRLRDYRSLSPEEQHREQERVLALLSRLGIGRGSKSQSQHPKHSASPSSISLNREQLLNDTMSPFLFPDCHSSPQTEERHNSSNPTGASTRSSGMQPPSPSTESVELPRGTKDASVSPVGRTPIYDSPEVLSATNPFKRQASTSAKRGADLYRTKYNEDVTIPPMDDSSPSSHTLSKGLSARMERLSISPAASDPKDIFSASQSPISPKLTYGSSSDSEESGERKPLSKNDIRQDIRSQRIGLSDETIETSATYGIHNRKLLREIPVNVGMKARTTFHLEKLDIKRCEIINPKSEASDTRRRMTNFQDPLLKYNTQQQRVLSDVVESLRRSEIDSLQPEVGTTSANALFSLTYDQIMDLCLRLLLDDEGIARDKHSKQNLNTRKGNTVIISRDKGEVKVWERALREGTGLSVFNHAEAPLSERVRLSTSEKAGKFDVVLTTYDALKGPDVAIPIDALGYAIVSSPDEESGWLNSRTTSSQPSQPQRCKQLSVLHRLDFRRAIFIDCLGRKSFLAKHGTSRASAAVALQAHSR